MEEVGKGRGVSAAPRGGGSTKGAALPTRLGAVHGEEETPPGVCKCRCAENFEAGAVFHGGRDRVGRGGIWKNPMELDGKEVPRFWPWLKRWGAAPGEGHRPRGARLRWGRGQSPSSPPRASPSPIPLPSSPWGWGPAADQGPLPGSAVATGQAAEARWWCPSGCECQKPCSYGAAPHRDQRALGSATRPSFPTRRLQGTSKGKIQTQKQRAGEGSPPTAPPQLAPSWGGSCWDRCLSAHKGTAPLVLQRGKVSPGPPPARPCSSAPYALLLPPAQQEQL